MGNDNANKWQIVVASSSINSSDTVTCSAEKKKKEESTIVSYRATIAEEVDQIKTLQRLGST